MRSAPRRRPTVLPAGVRRFLATEAAGGLVLVLAAALALLWANSPWRAGYASLWHTVVAFDVGPIRVRDDLHHAVDDGLMALFFFVVGLEIKRELVAGELRDLRVAALPCLAALGGMAVPALLYLAVNRGGPGTHGWGIPMATDIAFAVGVLALLGPRVPASLRLFLLSLAIVDDLGAILVIAVAYAGALDRAALGIALGGVAAGAVLRRAGVRWAPAYVALAVMTWFALDRSGIHPTLAGVAFALLVPARPGPDGAPSTAERVEQTFHPITSFVVVPLFALGNAGIGIEADVLRHPGAGTVAMGVLIGLVVGKTVGITGASWLAVRCGLAVLPAGSSWRQLVGVATLGGVGLTVSLLISGLAFDRPELEAAAALAVLTASLAASVIGIAILLPAPRRRPGATVG
jgi:NhaA family Na+:H+ antiporter